DLNNIIRCNRIYGNGLMGIDLYTPGPGTTNNDAGDADTGPNMAMNFPEQITVTESGADFIVSGILDHSSPAGCIVDIYKAATGSGYPQGMEWLGACVVSGAGTWTDTITGMISTDEITLTATDVDGNTSEFSPLNPLNIQNIQSANCDISVQNLSDGIAVRMNGVGKMHLRVISVSGAIVINRETNGFEEIRDLAPSVYYVECSFGERRVVKPVVVR
ncbi:MAG: hypothetical protein KKA07_07275, partial [Bacteroidetes bacterium]|nr:hypothetical protein [Bacteroidota bacterium]